VTKRMVLILLVVLFGISAFQFTGCSPARGTKPGEGGNNNTNTRRQWIYSRAQEQQLLDDTFRIDISTISVVFDYVPEETLVDCHAVVVFFMRPGQPRAVIHLDPAINGGTGVVSSILLNNESLNISDESDVRIIGFEGTTQEALEFQRDLVENRPHTLEMTYRLRFTPGSLPMFTSDVYDIVGRGNEEIFPTINTPHELARHHLTFRVHSDKPYRCIGSGRVEQVVQAEQGEQAQAARMDVQQWELDTGREVSSYTVMFFLLPEEDAVYEERTIEGVDVRVMAYVGGADIDVAFIVLEQLIPELIDNLGPFPMPHGVSIFLTSGEGGGMEYYGATITTLGALSHETIHLYYGCSAINKTYRDSWLDEAVTMWYGEAKTPAYWPVLETYTSDMVSGLSPAGVGFDTRAYTYGPHIIEAVARELGGRDEMIAFLKYIHTNYIFSPFTTRDFLDYLEDYAGVDMRDRFSMWVYSGIPISAAAAASTDAFILKHEVDLTPPKSILQKYGLYNRKKK
jgi:hypothetical protein